MQAPRGHEAGRMGPTSCTWLHCYSASCDPKANEVASRIRSYWWWSYQDRLALCSGRDITERPLSPSRQVPRRCCDQRGRVGSSWRDCGKDKYTDRPGPHQNTVKPRDEDGRSKPTRSGTSARPDRHRLVEQGGYGTGSPGARVATLRSNPRPNTRDWRSFRYLPSQIPFLALNFGPASGGVYLVLNVRN